jgi:hypothetical protein
MSASTLDRVVSAKRPALVKPTVMVMAMVMVRPSEKEMAVAP